MVDHDDHVCWFDPYSSLSTPIEILMAPQRNATPPAVAAWWRGFLPSDDMGMGQYLYPLVI
jgi:hypothetical protein